MFMMHMEKKNDIENDDDKSKVQSTRPNQRINLNLNQVSTTCLT